MYGTTHFTTALLGAKTRPKSSQTKENVFFPSQEQLLPVTIYYLSILALPICYSQYFCHPENEFTKHQHKTLCPADNSSPSVSFRVNRLSTYIVGRVPTSLWSRQALHNRCRAEFSLTRREVQRVLELRPLSPA